MREINERKLVTGVLRESGGLLIALIEAATEAFIVWGSSVNPVKLEKAAKRYLPPGK